MFRRISQRIKSIQAIRPISIVMVVFIVLVATYNQCALKPSEHGDSGLVYPPEHPQTIGGVKVEVQPEMGVKNFDQVAASMLVVTQMEERINNNIRNTISNAATQLPEKNEVGTFSAFTFLAVTKVATAICDELVDDRTARAALWPEFDFNANPDELRTTDKHYFIDQMVERFWGMIPNGGERHQEAHRELTQLFNDLLEGESNRSSSTRLAAKGVCVAGLATFDSLAL